eukprot:m.65642 g.65642  ORF g.65642 m.65642 type:complete len:779 (-) comp23583_c0_seq2:204-2540(-)
MKDIVVLVVVWLFATSGALADVHLHTSTSTAVHVPTVSLERLKLEGNWWVYENIDCLEEWRDLSPDSASESKVLESHCAGQTVDDCKIRCLHHPQCAGFVFPQRQFRSLQCVNFTLNTMLQTNLGSNHGEDVEGNLHKGFGDDSISHSFHLLQMSRPQLLDRKGHAITTPPLSPFPPIWPVPRRFTNGTLEMHLSHDFEFVFNASSMKSVSEHVRTSQVRMIRKAFSRYKRIMSSILQSQRDFGETNQSRAKKTSNTVLVSKVLRRESDMNYPRSSSTSKTHGKQTLRNNYPVKLSILMVRLDMLNVKPQSNVDLGINESYDLEIPIGAIATLTAANAIGVLRGLETFSQLVRRSCTQDIRPLNQETGTLETEGTNDFPSKSSSISACIPHAPWHIRDSPRFQHRGLLIDTARHFLPLPTIRRIIASLPFAKLNVLHWHMTDTQSFPMEVKGFSKLWHGAFSAHERYTQDEIRGVVEFARDQGVNVMIEIDMPGHAASWCVGYSSVCPAPACNQPLNIANNFTFDVIETILNELIGTAPVMNADQSRRFEKANEVAAIFPYNLMHVGGDEVELDCWEVNKPIMEWLKERSMSVHDGYGAFTTKVGGVVIAANKRPVYWDEVWSSYQEKIDKRSVIHVWKSKQLLQKVVASGFNAILSNADGDTPWYLDYLHVDWTQMYSNEPCDSLTKQQCAMVLGGQGNMWSESVDISNIEAVVWPRLGAIAEKLWSPKSKTSVVDDNVERRLREFRCRLVLRGVGASSLFNSVAGSAPEAPSSCFD